MHKPKKWITVNFQNISIISGKKHIYHNVQITKFSYDNLKFSLYVYYLRFMIIKNLIHKINIFK